MTQKQDSAASGRRRTSRNRDPRELATFRTSWEFSESWMGEDDVLARARERGQELGAPPISVGTGATLRLVAALVQAQNVVEVGTGAGVSGLWLLRGMTPTGVLTSVDTDGEHQRVARNAFQEAGISHTRLRLIPGRALDVLPRLADKAYDLVFIDGEKEEYLGCLAEAKRLLRDGGVVAFDNSLWHDKVADPAQRDPATVTIRELLKQVADDEELVPALLPVGDGLLLAQYRETAA